MPKENNKMQVDIENLFKQNVNDLSGIKELYRKLKEVEEKISQIKYIDINLANKLKKDYESLKRIILDENIQAKLANDIKTINSEMDTIVHKIYLKDIGFTVNDSGENNFKLLTNNLKDNTIFIVDDYYNLKFNLKTNLNYNLIFQGLNNKCGFNILSSSNKNNIMFELNNNDLKIELDNIKIDFTERVILINSWYGDKNLKKFICNNCIINGDNTILRFKNANDIPLTELKSGEYYITNNKISNNHYSLFYMDNCPHELIKIDNNTLKNLAVRLCVASADPTGTYFSEIVKNKKLTIIENNTLINDDDFYCSNEMTGFIGSRCVKSIFRNNHTEGLKTYEDIPLYDCYLSGEIVIYEDNVYKNNIKITETGVSDPEYALIKSKARETANIGERKYRNNKFIIEKDYLSKYTDNECYVNLIDVFNECSYEIVNNIIDVPFLSFQNGGQNYTKLVNLNFKNNIIKCEKTNNYSMFEIGDSSIDFEICGNEINVNDTNNIFTMLINKRTNKSALNNLIIKDNTITSNGVSKLLLEKVSANNNFTFKNNVIKNLSTNESRIMFDQSAKIIDVDYNLIQKTYTGLCDLRLTDDFNYNVVLKSNLCLPNSSNNRLILPDDILLNSQYYVKIIFDDNIIYYSFKITNDGVSNSITFTNSDGKEKTILINKIADTEYTLKSNLDKPHILLRFQNETYAPRLRFLRGSYSDTVYNNKKLSISITSFKL